MKRTFVFLVLALIHAQSPYAETDVFAEDPKAKELSNQLERPDMLHAQLKVRQGILLTSEMSGRISRFSLHTGERFVAGQTLATVSCPKGQARLKELKAVLGNYEKLKQQMDNTYTINALEIDMADTEYQVVQADVRVAEALVERCVVKAPFSGKVVKLYAKASQTVRTGDALLEIVDDGQEVELLVQSSEMTRIKVGQQYKVSMGDTAKPYTVELLNLGGRVDPVSQTVKIYGRIAETTAKAEPATESVVALMDSK